MDDVSKFIRQLSDKDRERIILLLSRIIKGDLVGLDSKKLRGYEGIFRVRVGRIRVIYQVRSTGVLILQVGFRSEDTNKP